MLKSLATLLMIASILLANAAHAENSTSASGIPLNTDWKKWIYDFSQENLQHSAWGLSHYERDYNLAITLAMNEGINIDEEVLFAAALLHDIGVFAPYVIDGAEHSKTAADNVEKLLSATSFPMTKIQHLKTVIMSHMFYAKVTNDNTARVLHDADTLDFIGSIGAARILSITTRHPWSKDLPSAVSTIEKFNQTLPGKLITKSAKEIANDRTKEATAFVDALKKESSAGVAL